MQHGIWRLVLIVSLALGVPAGAAAAPAPPGSRVPWQGGSWYLSGANLPWFNWGCDFGCAAKNGVSAPDVSNGLNAKFQQAHTSGLHIVRWWTFEGDPWQITRDTSGAPTTIDPAVFQDFDAALQLAQTYDLYYDFVLFSAPTAIPKGWLTNSAQRQQLANALAPLFAHYHDNPRVLSWEVFNEPEWDIWNNKADAGATQATVRAVADAVHANSTAYVTVGSASISGLPLWVNQHLDYYQAHWYDPQKGNDCARCTDYDTVKQRYSLDAPLVIGEFYAPASTDSAQRLADFYNRGYAGAWTWSLAPERTSDHFALDFAATQAFAKQHSDLGPGGSGAAEVVAAPVPAAAAVPTVHRFILGFAALRDLLSGTMGDPVENEHSTPDNCDTQQLTSTGLSYWRCDTNTMTFVTFPDGLHHWALIDGQVVEWVGASPDPPGPPAAS